MRFCESCGAQLPDGVQFCPACGQRVQPQPVQPQTAPAQTPVTPPRPPRASGRNGKLLFLLLGVVLACAVAAALWLTGVLRLGGSAGKVEGPGFDSAEDAALAYAEALKAGDMDAMLATFAMESYVEHFDAESNYLRMGAALSLTSSGALMPPADQAPGLNLEARRTQVFQQIYYQYISLLLHGTAYEESFPGTIALPEPEDVGDLMDVLRRDPGFDKMTIGEAIDPEDVLDGSYLEHYRSETFRENQARFFEPYGARDIQDVCLELTIDGEEYYLLLTAFRYGGKWYNANFGGQLGALLGISSAAGGLVPASELAS